MGSMIFKVIAFFTLISAVCAQHSLYFTNVPDTGVVVGEHYNVDWTGGDYSSPITLTLQRGSAGEAEDIAVLSSVANGYSYDFFPGPELEDGDNYLLKVSQGTTEDFSPVFALSGGRAAAASTSSSASSTFSTSTRAASSTSAAPTSSVTEAPTAIPAQTTSSSSNTVPILIATPTSSFDAPREEDKHMTINDKFALGFGIPIILIVLSTLGYWRATKYFLHRKVTGEPKLPVYGSYEEARTGSNPDFRGSWSSRPASLWGAASRRGSVVPPTVQGPFSDSTELLTAPKITHSNADARLSQSSLRAPSALRQEWRGV